MTVNCTANTVCVPSENIVAREIEGEIVIVPLVSGIGDADDELYALNETGIAVWKHLDGAKSLGQIVAILARGFDAEESTISGDVIGFASAMLDRGILRAA